jgi:hypothetical protein
MRGQRRSRTTRRSAAAGRNHTAVSGDLGRAGQLGGLVAIPQKTEVREGTRRGRRVVWSLAPVRSVSPTNHPTVHVLFF